MKRAYSKIIAMVWLMLAGLVSVRGAETNRLVVAIYHSGIGHSRGISGPQVIAALWSGGRVVWSRSDEPPGLMSCR